MSSPHLSRAEIKLREDIKAAAPNQAPILDRATAGIQYRTDFNEDTRRFEPMTADQKAKCDELGKILADAGVELSITLSLRDGEEVKNFPKVATFAIYPNKPRDQAPAPAPAPAAASAAPASWDAI